MNKKQTKRNMESAWIARWWARRVFDQHGDCQRMWWYLILAEATEQGDGV